MHILNNLPELDSEDSAKYLITGLRLFTRTPYPEFDYVVTPNKYPYCANQSLYSYLRKSNFWLKWVDVTPDLVLGYVTEQIAILRYNNPDADKNDTLMTFLMMTRWGSENALDKIAYDTVLATLNTVYEVDNYDDIINMTYKSVWYSDNIMKPPRIQGETWKEYVERLRKGKIAARSRFKNMEAKSIIEEESLTLQSNSGGVIPTPQMLNNLTEIPVRKIKEVTEEDRVWQTKTKMNIQIIKNLKKTRPEITQNEISEVLGISTRQVRKILNLKL